MEETKRESQNEGNQSLSQRIESLMSAKNRESHGEELYKKFVNDHKSLLESILDTNWFFEKQYRQLMNEIYNESPEFEDLRSLHASRAETLRKIIKNQRQTAYDIYIKRLKSLKDLKNSGIFGERKPLSSVVIDKRKKFSSIFDEKKPFSMILDDRKPDSNITDRRLSNFKKSNVTSLNEIKSTTSIFDNKQYIYPSAYTNILENRLKTFKPTSYSSYLAPLFPKSSTSSLNTLKKDESIQTETSIGIQNQHEEDIKNKINLKKEGCLFSPTNKEKGLHNSRADEYTKHNIIQAITSEFNVNLRIESNNQNEELEMSPEHEKNKLNPNYHELESKTTANNAEISQKQERDFVNEVSKPETKQEKSVMGYNNENSFKPESILNIESHRDDQNLDTKIKEQYEQQRPDATYHDLVDIMNQQEQEKKLDEEEEIKHFEMKHEEQKPNSTYSDLIESNSQDEITNNKQHENQERIRNK